MLLTKNECDPRISVFTHLYSGSKTQKLKSSPYVISSSKDFLSYSEFFPITTVMKKGHFDKLPSPRPVWKFFFPVALTSVFQLNFACIAITHLIIKLR